ncbi:MAG TPA: efflux RND transporter periplasmic adaptor subunit, partial [Candidatus Manganitrophaceae bacterium]|nr:efflux RND transporter periplasmic adaptor subunit [Candidatus Manganitrophaceae bacterium]
MMKTYLIPFLITVASFLLILMLAYDPIAQGTAVDEPKRSKRDDSIRLDEKTVRNIRIEEIRLKPAQTKVAFSGKVEYDPDRFIPISSPVSGKVAKIIAEIGDQVTEGEPLLAVESAEISAAYADFSRCRLEAAHSQEQFELARTRYQAALLSKKELQQAIDETLRAESELNLARSRLRALNVSEGALHPHLAVPPFLYLRSPCA